MDYFDYIVLTVAAVVSYRKDLSDLIPIVSQRQKYCLPIFRLSDILNQISSP